jgi:hypothetical protein
MAATNLVIPEVDSAEGYEEPINVHTDGLGAAGFFPQHPTIDPHDLSVGIERDALNNLVLKDSVTGSKTLAQLTGSSGVSTYDFLLDCEPPSVGTVYAVVRTAGKVSSESWINVATSHYVKTIDYTRVGGLVSSEVRKVFAPDGVTVVAQLTVVYTRTGGRVTGADYTRDI